MASKTTGAPALPLRQIGLYAATNPTRGLQDRLAGTYLVPR